MRIINLSQLYDKYFELSDLFAINQIWYENNIFTMDRPRKCSAILYFNGCDGIYQQSDDSYMNVEQGNLVYIPFGSVYSCKFFNCNQNTYSTILIEFNTKDNMGCFSFNDEPFIINPAYTKKHADKIKEIISAFEEPLFSPLIVKSHLYKIFYDLSKMYRKEIPSEFKNIEKGILYLEDYTNSDINIEDIASMCHVSSDCFRRLFKKYSGMTPIEYRNHSQLIVAKRMLKHSYLSINDISDRLGFSDVSYFCRFFKKHIGLTPSEYRKKTNI